MWHMHQPDYRDVTDGRYLLPWVYLHAVKDYSDMVAHLERHPGVRAVVNFVPVLLAQIEDYVRQFDEGCIRDPLLGMLQVADLDELEAHERRLILDSCFHNNHDTMLRPFPQYSRLLELFRVLDRGENPRYDYLSGAFLGDLLAWYHLVWIGETERRSNPLFGRLMAKGEGFTHGDRLQLFQAIGEILRGLLPRYRALVEAGRIEMSTTPQTHPLSPLLIDFGCAREAMPDVVLPQEPAYPGGHARVRWHLSAALDGHRERFGAAPAGLWPAEGAVSGPFLEEVARAGLRWAASSETVLANSLGGRERGARGDWLYRPWRSERAPGLTIFFRDERLSDQIGFEYAKWHGRDAAAHLVGELERIAREAPPGEVPLVLIALDGENAWEFYPFNGYYFFEELYGALEAHPSIRTWTFEQWLGSGGRTPRTLPALVSGSWVMGTMSTWIGEESKNRAWDLLCRAKRAFDEVLAAGTLDDAQRAKAFEALAGCESSDWFWWLGPYNPSHAVQRFERLFRHDLRRLYSLIGREPPPELDAPLASGGGHPEAGGAIRRASVD
jgi:alpha-amylase/alpha-mannosidase (GH57 family)